jgi:hydroxymethylbilane synthase
MKTIRIGTRRSRLATIQTQIVTDIIRLRYPGMQVEIVPLSTLGDRLPPRRRPEVEGKAAFTDEIDDLLLGGAIDLAVHSMKDLPNESKEGLVIGATPVRADPRDVLVTRVAGGVLSSLRSGAMIGTSSIRRKAQLLAMRKDLEVVDLHGNVDTRLSKMDKSDIDGIVIAAAGLDRLGESDRISEYFSSERMVPAPCQGAIAVEMREGDEETAAILASVDDKGVRAETICERSFAKSIGGDCDLPAGANAVLAADRLTLTGAILSPDGTITVNGSLASAVEEAEALGDRLARRLLDSGGADILRRYAG